jgi:RNase P/RNase MRP subunit p29
VDVKSRTKKVNKGAPSGLVISLLFHAAAFFIAGLFVVFTVVRTPEPEFVAPPPVERPKMNLKKPKVKVKKSSTPKPSSRIVAKVKTKQMPEIQLPDLMGTGDGLMDGTGLGGDFLDLPEIEELSVFGSEITTGNDLEGRFYQFCRLSSGQTKSILADEVDTIIHQFLKRGWDLGVFSKYYRSPKKLYTSCVCIGTVQSLLAPRAFGEMEAEGYAWAVHYTGKLVYPEDIKFRFRAVGDKFMAIRVDGKTVLICSYKAAVRNLLSDVWSASASDDRIYAMGEDRQGVGDWIELKGGQPVDLEILIGEREGGLVYHQVAVEVYGVDYPKNPYGNGPTCPVFKTDMLTRAQIDAMYLDTYPGDICLTNGPVFSDYTPKPIQLDEPPVTNPPPPLLEEVAEQMRTWTVQDKTVEAKFLLEGNGYILVEQPNGKQIKLPPDQVSEADQRFLEMRKAPKFRKLDFSKKHEKIDITKYLGPYVDARPASVYDWTFGVKMKEPSVKEYSRKLTVEYFAVGREINGDNYILLERNSSDFTLSKENNYSHEFYGKKIRMMEYTNRASSPMRGRDYGGYLVVISDEDGNIVQHQASSEFLFEYMQKLQKLPVNAHFDKWCNRTYPPRLIDADRGGAASWD